MKKKFKAIIFDLDGTLLDTIDDIAYCANKILKKYNFPLHKTYRYKLFVGDGIETLVYKILPKDKREPKLIKEIVSRIKLEYKNNFANKTKVYTGIMDLLNMCQLKNIKMSILSNKPDKFTKIMVKHFFPQIKFSFVFGTKKNLPKKPNPTTALLIAKKLKLKLNEFVYLGDTDTDMQTAKNAKMFAVGVLWGFRTRNELIKSGANIVIKSPMELFEKGFI